MFPIKKYYRLEDIPAANRWGAKRKHDYHTGVDLFCPDQEPVFAFEDGIVTDVALFTGEAIGMPWWAETWCLAVEGESGVILYGELYKPVFSKGDKIEEGEFIGKVKTVLLKDKGKPMSMLHIEWYEKGYRGNWDGWWSDQDKPKDLKNIEELIFKNHKPSDFYDIREEFVPFELSKLLKDANFNLPCLAWYDNITGQFNILGQESMDNHPEYIHTTFFTPEITQAPLWSQVLRWLKMEHRLLLTTQQNIDFGLDNDLPKFTGEWIFCLDWVGKYKRKELGVRFDKFKNESAALTSGLLAALGIIKIAKS